MAGFSEENFQNEVREILKDYSKAYQDAGEKVIASVLDKIHNGEPVTKAVHEALSETGFQATYDKAVTDVVLLAACAGYGVRPEMLTEVSQKTLTRHLLDDAWAEDNVKLSRRLHTLDVEKRVAQTIQTAMRSAKTIRDTAMELYDGYNTGDGVIDRSHLTRQLGKIVSLARTALSGDEEAAREVRKAARKVKQYALNLQTTNLRTAYAELADVCGDALSEKALNRAVRAAIEERTRYHAERIARTEAARAWYDGYIARTQDDDDVWGYRWVLSSRHALVPFDQCDVCANANVGYGKGVYPKNRVPSIPRHPHCMCSLVDVIVGETEGQSRKMNEDGARSYIDSLDDHQLMQLFGEGGREAYKNGGDWQNLLRGWDGFVEPVSRLNPKLFEMEEWINTGENGKIEAGEFQTKADPMRDVLGPAEKTNPKQLQAFKEELHILGVELRRPDEEKLAYEPSTEMGKPGIVIISKGASYSAWVHEMTHVRDDHADGWLGLSVLMNAAKSYGLEKHAYAQEIKLAKKLPLKERKRVISILKKNLAEERRHYYGVERNDQSDEKR